MEDIERLLKILGFAHRARKLSLGMDSALQAVTKGRAKVVLLADDLSEMTRRKFELAAMPFKVPIRTCGSKAAYGRALGREETGIIAVTDAMFAKSIVEILG